MAIDNKTILKNSSIVYVRLIITSVVNLYATRLLLLALGIEDFGIYTVVGGIVQLASIINTIMVSATNRFIAYGIGKGDKENVNQLFNVTSVIHCSISVIVLLFGLILGYIYIRNFINIPEGTLDKALLVFIFSLLGAAFSFIGIPYQGLLIAVENYFAFSIRDIIISILKLLCIFTLSFFLTNKVVVYALFILALNIIQVLWNYTYCRTKYYEIVHWHFVSNIQRYKEILNFSLWTGYGAISWVGNAQGIPLIINYYFGVAVNSALGIAGSVSAVVSMFGNSLGSAITPQITKNCASGNLNTSIKLAERSSRFTFILLFIPISVLFVCLDNILTFWLTNVPQYTSTFIKLYLLNALVMASNAGIPDLITATGRIKKYQLVVNSISLLTLPFSFFVLYIYREPQIAIIVQIIISLVVVIVRQLISQTLIKYDGKSFVCNSIIRSFGISIIGFPMILTFVSLSMNIIPKIVIVFFMSITLCMMIGVTRKEKKVLFNYLRARHKEWKI